MERTKRIGLAKTPWYSGSLFEYQRLEMLQKTVVTFDFREEGWACVYFPPVESILEGALSSPACPL